MTGKPDSGPFHSREQAEAVFDGFRRAALDGVSGPPGEQLLFTYSQHLAEALIDAVEGFGARLGDYDRQLIDHLAVLLDPVEISVICSWVYRAHDINGPGIRGS